MVFVKICSLPAPTWRASNAMSLMNCPVFRTEPGHPITKATAVIRSTPTSSVAFRSLRSSHASIRGNSERPALYFVAAPSPHAIAPIARILLFPVAWNAMAAQMVTATQNAAGTSTVAKCACCTASGITAYVAPARNPAALLPKRRAVSNTNQIVAVPRMAVKMRAVIRDSAVGAIPASGFATTLRVSRIWMSVPAARRYHWP